MPSTISHIALVLGEYFWFDNESRCSTLMREYYSLRLVGCFFMFDRLFEENVNHK